LGKPEEKEPEDEPEKELGVEEPEERLARER
jgi:hypothetical protein